MRSAVKHDSLCVVAHAPINEEKAQNNYFIYVHYAKGRKVLRNNFHPTEIRRFSLHPTKVASRVILRGQGKPNIDVSIALGPSGTMFTPYSVHSFVRLFLTELARFSL